MRRIERRGAEVGSALRVQFAVFRPVACSPKPENLNACRYCVGALPEMSWLSIEYLTQPSNISSQLCAPQ